jgi:hypothetical protein
MSSKNVLDASSAIFIFKKVTEREERLKLGWRGVVLVILMPGRKKFRTPFRLVSF